MSGDGSTIATDRLIPSTAFDGYIGYWVPIKIINGEVEELPLPLGYESAFTRRISQDGSTVVGVASSFDDDDETGSRSLD